MSNNTTVDRCSYNPGDLIDSKYVVQKTLGEGSFGVVYLVNDRLSGCRSALKLLRLWEVPADIRTSLKERFQVEYDTGQINCSNLVQSLTYGLVGGNPYIVMEYCPGGDLNSRIGSQGNNVPKICQEVLLGLNALHVRGLVHRDLKPENVLFKQDGTAALTDFGIVGDRNHRLTQRSIFDKPQQIFGTYAYMPPEQAGRMRGGATVLPTTDIFSFGVLAYQLLTGRLPFGPLESHDDLTEYLERSKEGRWEQHALHSVANGQQWRRLIDGCLQPNFKDRLRTAKEVLHLLPYSQAVSQGHRSESYYSSYLPKKHTKGYQIRVLKGEEHGRVYNLSQGQHQQFTIGRGQNNRISTKSEYSDYISRQHCTIETSRYRKSWLVRDGQWNPSAGQWMESRNGTYVNVRPVSAKGFYLQPGDIITMGDVTIRFENY